MSLEEINAPVPPYTGRGVIVGIIDNGIDIYHAAFRQGSETRILNIWDQTITEGPVSAEGYGREFTQSDIERVLEDLEEGRRGEVYHRDTTGHGTFVASIAAGKRNVEYSGDGVATDARLAIVKLATPSVPEGPAMDSLDRPGWEMDDGERRSAELATLFGDALRHIERVARESGFPFVVNTSSSWTVGPRDGTGLIAQEINRLLLDDRDRPVPGRAVVAACGNDRAARRHWRGIVNLGSRIRVDVRPVNYLLNNESFAVDIWYKAPRQVQVRLALTDMSPVDSLTVSPGDNVRGDLSPLFNARIRSRHLPADNNFRVQCRVVPTAPILRPRQFEIELVETTGAGALVDVWAAYGLAGPEVSFHPCRQENTITPESTAQAGIAVGLYRGGATDEIGPRSSIGVPNPPRGHRRLPDLVAPGYQIEGARARGIRFGSPGSTDNTCIDSGTSYAAPFVTGVVALMLEKNPTLTYLDIRRILRESANRNPDEIVERQRPQMPRDAEGNHIWGAGKLDARAALDLTRERG